MVTAGCKESRTGPEIDGSTSRTACEAVDEACRNFRLLHGQSQSRQWNENLDRPPAGGPAPARLCRRARSHNAVAAALQQGRQIGES